MICSFVDPGFSLSYLSVGSLGCVHRFLRVCCAMSAPVCALFFPSPTSGSHLRSSRHRRYLLDDLSDFVILLRACLLQIPRLLGPGLTKAGKFPTLVNAGDNLQSKVDTVRATIKFQMKKVRDIRGDMECRCCVREVLSWKRRRSEWRAVASRVCCGACGGGCSICSWSGLIRHVLSRPVAGAIPT